MIDLLTAYGVVAVVSMLLFYALEPRYACSCSPLPGMRGILAARDKR